MGQSDRQTENRNLNVMHRRGMYRGLPIVHLCTGGHGHTHTHRRDAQPYLGVQGHLLGRNITKIWALKDQRTTKRGTGRRVGRACYTSPRVDRRGFGLCCKRLHRIHKCLFWFISQFLVIWLA